jgi:hypothetical protein
MAIPNAKKYRLKNPSGAGFATIMAVLPRDADVDAYIKDATGRFDWKAWNDARAAGPKVRVGQQKQKKKS